MPKRHFYCFVFFLLVSRSTYAQSSGDFEYKEMRVDEVNLTHLKEITILEDDYFFSSFLGPCMEIPNVGTA